jgi:hypothetical protein
MPRYLRTVIVVVFLTVILAAVAAYIHTGPAQHQPPSQPAKSGTP